MLRKLFLLILVFTLSGIFAYGQDKKVPESKDKEAAKAYTFLLGGSGSYLGVQTKEVTKENFAKFGLSDVRGVVIEKVIKDSPAEKAGLQDGDVIVRFNGESVTSTQKLTRLISEVAPDHKAALTVIRNGGEQDLTATITERNAAVFQNSGTKLENLYGLPGIPEFPTSPVDPRVWKIPAPSKDMADALTFFSNYSMGIGVTSLTKQLGEYFGVAEGKGVLINNVTKNSPAERAGLIAGDVIVEIEGQEVNSNADLLRRMSGKDEGVVNLTIIRNKNRQTISITPEKRNGNPLTVEELEKIESKLKTRFAPQTITVPFSTSTRIL